MADIDSLLAAASAKRDDVASASVEKQFSMPTPDQAYAAAVGMGTNRGFMSAGPLEQDLRTMSPARMLEAYGNSAVGLLAQQERANQAYALDVQADRTLGQGLGDSWLGGASSFLGSFGNIAALGAGLVSPEVGANISADVQSLFDDTMREQSDPLAAARRVQNARMGLELRDNEAQYQQDILEGGSKITSGLSKIGRDFLDSVSVSTEDATTFQQGTVDAVGSLLAGGPIGKGVKTVVGAAAKGAGAAGATAGTVARLERFGEQAAMPAAIAAMEGGGAFVQTTEEVQSMSFDELSKNSPEFNTLVSGGMSQEEARNELANLAGLQAAAITMPAAAATGALVSRFEAAPFRVPSVREAAANVLLKEPAEEAVQSATGQLAQNIAISNTADVNQDIIEGVGEQGGQGALFGFSAAGAVQAPGAVGRGTMQTLRYGGDLAKRGLNSLLERGRRIAEENEEASPIADQAMREVAAQATAAAPQAQQAIMDSIETSQTTPEEKAKGREVATQLFNALKIPDYDYDPSNQIDQIVSGSSNRIEAIQNLAEAVRTADEGSDFQLDAAWTLMQLTQDLDVVQLQEAGVLDSLPDESKQMLDQYARVISNASNSPKVIRALRKVQELVSNVQVQDVTPESLNTPEGIQNVRNAVAIAQADPSKGNLQATEVILQQARDGGLQLTPRQMQALEVQRAVLRAAQQDAIERERLGLRPQDLVSKQIKTGTSKTGEGKESILQHSQGVLAAKRAGNDDLAAARLADLGKFAKHMTNKVAAVNSHFATGDSNSDRVTYMALHPSTREWYESPVGLGVTPTSVKSLEFVQGMALEAKAAVDVFNSLAEAFPELNAAHVEPVLLDASLNGPASQLANEFRSGRRSAGAPVTPNPENVTKVTSAAAADNTTTQTVQQETDLQDTSQVTPEMERANEESKQALQELTPGDVETNSQSLLDSDLDILVREKAAAAKKAIEPKFADAEQVMASIVGGEALLIHTRNGDVDTIIAMVDGEKAGDLTFEPKSDVALSVDVEEDFRRRRIAEAMYRFAAERGNFLVGRTTNDGLTHSFLDEGAKLRRNMDITRVELSEVGADAIDVALTPEQQALVDQANALMRPDPMKMAYPDLVEGSQFITAFNLPDNPISNFAGSETTISEVRDILSSAGSLSRFLGSTKGHDYSTSVAKAFTDYLGGAETIARIMKKNLSTFLNTKDVGKRFAAGEEVNRWADGKVLNLVKPKGESFVYDTGLLQNAILAGMQWLLRADSFGSIVDEQALKAMTNMDPEVLSEDTINALAQGMGEAEMIRSLATKIRDYWGVVPDRNEPLGYTAGIPQAMASEVLRALLEDGSIERVVVNLDEDGRRLPDDTPSSKAHRTIYRYVVPSIKDTPLAEFPDVIDQVVLVEPEQVTYIGPDAIPPVADRQMNNPAVQNTREQKAALKAEQETPFYIHTPMLGIYEALGEVGVLKLFGVDADPEKLNVNHAQSVEGKNRSIIAAYNSLMDLAAEVSNMASNAGVDVDQMPIRYAYNFSRVGRMQMLGRYNPQSTKLVREAVLPTRSTIDLSNPSSDAYKAFTLGLGQALGIKVHNMSVEMVSEKLDAMLIGGLAPAVDRMVSWHSSGGPLSSNDVQLLKSSFKAAGADLTFAGLHALVEYARFKGTSDKSNFTTSIYLEADGVTNGPVNAMMLMSIGDFDQNFLTNVGKGGVFFGPSKTTNEHRQFSDSQDLYQTATNNLTRHISRLAQDIKRIPELTEQLNQLLNMMDLFVKDLVWDEETGELTLSRGIAKNPLTITIYGSGARGIAGNVVDTIVESLYERMSDMVAQGSLFPNDPDAAAKMERFEKAFDALTSKQVLSGRNGLYLDTLPQTKHSASAKEFTLTRTEIEALRNNVLHLFVQPLRDGIADTVGQSLSDSVTILRKATQVQSIFLQHAFQEAIQEALEQKAKDPNWKKSDFLSQADLDKILADMKDLAPMIDTGSQRFFIAGSMATDIKTSEFSRSLDGKMRVPAAVYGPMDAGVSGIPFMIIGMGDGQMMQILSTMPGAPKGTLKIFDGMNMPLDKVTDYSRKANDAVYQTWQTNPLEEVAKSYRTFMQNVSTEGISDEMLGQLQRAFGDDELSAGSIDTELAFLMEELENASKSVAARHKAMSSMAMSIDQMAAAGAPYVNNGDTVFGPSVKQPKKPKTLRSLIQDRGLNTAQWSKQSFSSSMSKEYVGILRKDGGMSVEDAREMLVEEGFLTEENDNNDAVDIIIQALNEDVFLRNQDEKTLLAWQDYQEAINQTAHIASMTPDELLAELNARYASELVGKVEEQETVEPVEMPEPIEQVGRADRTGVRILSYTALRNLSKLIGMTNTQKAIFDQIQRSMSAKGYKVVYGTAEQIRDYQASRGLEQRADDIDGFTSIGDKTIYLMNPGVETLVHELIHASTFEKVLDHYNGNSTPEVSEAIARIEEMMNQFLTMDPSGLSPAGRADFDAAVAAINAWKFDLNQSQEVSKAGALNEFMAWALANEQLSQNLKSKKAPKIVQLAKDAIAWIKKLVWGRKQVDLPADDMLSNLQFNTAIIIRSQTPVSGSATDVKLQQNRNYGTSDRLTQINDSLSRQINKIYDPASPNSRLKDSTMAAVRLANSAQAHGFPMTAQESNLFKTIVVALSTEADIDPNALAGMQRMYSHVTKNLSVSDFMKDPQAMDPADEYQAQQKYGTIVGNFAREVDASGRSSLLPVFAALAVVNEDFRTVLNKMELPKGEKDNSTIDGILYGLGNAAIDNLTRRLSGQNNAKTVREAIDNMIQHIQDVADNTQSFLDQAANKAGGALDRANTYLIESAERLSDAAIDKADTIINNENSNRIAKYTAQFGKLLASIVSEKNGARVSQGVMQMMNQANVWEPFHTFLNDLVGRTENNADVYDMIKTVRAMVQQDRQQFREDVPTIIAGKFSRELTDAEWGTLHTALGKTDLAVLRKSMSPDRVMQMFTDPTALQQEITARESAIQQATGSNWNRYRSKMQQLSNFMLTGEPGNNLLRNANAIALLPGYGKGKSWTKPDAKTVRAIDELVTLYTVNNLKQSDKDSMASLVQGERNGVEFSLSYMVGQRLDEQTKAIGVAALNHYKGYIPTLNQPNVSLIVADDVEFNKLRQQSYTRVGPYNGSSLDKFARSKSYYFAPVNGRAVYNQGIIQNVRRTASGVDTATGFTHDMMTAGRITDPATVRKISFQIQMENAATGESLMPVFDAAGKVVAYEKSVNPHQLQALNPTNHFANMVGVWRGRQVEEAKAQFFNEKLIDTLKAMYDRDQAEGRSNEYVNILGSNDPVIQDAVRLFTPETMEYIETQFGDEFWVRRDMLNDAIGYRSATIGDAWSGNTRWSKNTQESVRDLALAVFGNDAYRYLVRAEQLLENFVADARVTIVVKSIIVPVSNLISNAYQLISRGVPMAFIAREMPKKTAEIDSYVKSRIRQIEAEAELRAAANDIVAQRKLKAEIQSITDSHKRLSIWPLLEAGEFTSISDVGLTHEEIQLTEGKLNAYVESLVSKLPAPLQTAGKYALVTRDTALYQGLQKAIQYGDFLAKAVLYDDLTKRQKKSKEYALGRITEEFVNYDRLPGRFRGKLESLGLLWFYNYKIRISKIAVSTIRNNPLHALLATSLPTPEFFGSVGLPIEDNLFAKMADGSLDYSMGLGQGIRAPLLNPWINLAY